MEISFLLMAAFLFSSACWATELELFRQLKELQSAFSSLKKAYVDDFYLIKGKLDGEVNQKNWEIQKLRRELHHLKRKMANDNNEMDRRLKEIESRKGVGSMRLTMRSARLRKKNVSVLKNEKFLRSVERLESEVKNNTKWINKIIYKRVSGSINNYFRDSVKDLEDKVYSHETELLETGYSLEKCKKNITSLAFWVNLIKEVDCGPPPTLSGGTTEAPTVTKTTVGSVALYTCNTDKGYKHVSGRNTSMCLPDKQWSPPEIECQIDCGSPPSLSGATVVYARNATTVGSVVVYLCDTDQGYMPLSGTNNTAVCLPEGHWSPPDIECRRDFTDKGYKFNKTARVWYRVYGWSQKKNWSAAAEICKGEGGILISSHTPLRIQLVNHLWRIDLNGYPPWIGCNDREVSEHWMWMDRTVLDGSNWYPGQPNEEDHCCYQYFNANWFGLPCHFKLSFICELLPWST